MIEMKAEKRFTNQLPRKTLTPSPLTAEYIGRFRKELTPFEIAFIQRRTQPYLHMFGYEPEPVNKTQTGSVLDWLLHSTSLVGWQMINLMER
jgi:hypothetical protein